MGAIELLERLASANIPIALIRNSELDESDFQKRLSLTGTAKYFDVKTNVVLSGELGFEKPDPKIFVHCLRKCKLQHQLEKSPHRVLYIGNETDVDIVGANAVGWKSCLIRNTEKTSNGRATFEVDNFEEIWNLIKGDV